MINLLLILYVEWADYSNISKQWWILYASDIEDNGGYFALYVNGWSWSFQSRMGLHGEMLIDVGF